MQNSYLFYDIETTGLNKCFDQVLQFAAIRTDLELNEIEQYEIKIKLNPDVLPSPGAVLVHQITLEEMQSGIREYEAVKTIHQLFNTPGTITVGYNNLGFDDEFLRFSFYRNLFPPYTHQYASNCGRMDIYPMVVLYYLFKSDLMIWPKIDGLVSLKLEHLSAQNNLVHDNAHDAMSDVKATLQLARLLKKERDMWEYVRGAFDKKIDIGRLEKLTLIDGRYQQALLIDGSIGSAKFYQSPVLGLGLHNHYKNQSLWLPLDLFLLESVNLNNIATTTFVNRKRFGEPPILLPLSERFGRYLSSERLDLMKANLAWIKKNAASFFAISDYHKNYKYPDVPNLDIDAALYQNGFISDSERSKCEKFHAANPGEKLKFISHFSDPNLAKQAIRILGRNYPDILREDNVLCDEFTAYLDKIKSGVLVVNYKNEPHLTPQGVLSEIENLRQTKNLSARQNGLLHDLARYIQSW